MSKVSSLVERCKVGAKFGKLEVCSEPFYVHHGGKRPKRRLHCKAKCECGRVVDVLCFNLRPTSTCVECHKEKLSDLYRQHGDSRTRLHGCWKNMVDRCSNPANKRFKYYGGRGITVCEGWRNDYLAFRQWALANGFDETLQIDRIDNDGGYEPANCRFVTQSQNARNKSNNRRVTAFGETKCLVEWSEDSRCQVALNVLELRLNQMGWDFEQALLTPNLKKDHLATFRGETRTLTEWSKRLGVCLGTLRNRLERGSTVEDAFTKPVKPRAPRRPTPKGGHLLTLNGEARTITWWARHLGISLSTLQGRLLMGWTVEDALRKPVAYKATRSASKVARSPSPPAQPKE